MGERIGDALDEREGERKHRGIIQGRPCPLLSRREKFQAHGGPRCCQLLALALAVALSFVVCRLLLSCVPRSFPRAMYTCL